MEQEYTTSTGYKIFYSIGLIAFFGFALILPLLGNHGGYSGQPGLLVLAVIVVAISVFTVLNFFKRKLIITDYTIKYTNVWGASELSNKDVKGFKIFDKRIVIYSSTTSQKIKIRDYSSIGNLDDLLKCLGKYYTNLDSVAYQDNLNEIYNDAALGHDQKEREFKLDTSKRFSLIYNVGGGIIFALSLAFTDFILKSDWLKVLLIFYPLIGIILLIWGKGSIKLVYGKNSAYPSIIVGIYASTILIFIVLITYYDFISYSDLWVPVLIIALIIGSVLWRFGYDKSANAAKGQIFMLILVAVFYSCPLTMLINSKLDISEPKIYNSKIVNRYIFHNNGREYYHVVISTSDYSNLSSKDLHINYELYNRIKDMQIVNVTVKQGLLHIPWFYINE
ncbi:hypothetical protein ACPPVU_06665 [Mucilaginibacter sp. McL0603]|uniref:hypothetical protein n=1 Tax=Mucilaginibacter sp. McL0603 TaxID=3415670 RepID=UPI003CF3D4EF